MKTQNNHFCNTYCHVSNAFIAYLALLREFSEIKHLEVLHFILRIRESDDHFFWSRKIRRNPPLSKLVFLQNINLLLQIEAILDMTCVLSMSPILRNLWSLEPTRIGEMRSVSPVLSVLAPSGRLLHWRPKTSRHEPYEHIGLYIFGIKFVGIIAIFFCTVY